MVSSAASSLHPPGPVRRLAAAVGQVVGARTAPVWLLATALLGTALWLHLDVLPGLHAPSSAVPLPWWLLAAGFFLSEVGVVHYDFRRQAHSFSLFELPLTFGLFFAAPQDLVLATGVGVGLALLVHRRQVGLKLVFNLGHFVLGACLAVLLFHAVAEPALAFTPASWVGALLAALASSSLSTGAIVLAICLSEGRFELSRLPEQLGLALLTTVGGTSLGLMGVGVTGQNPVAAWLLVVPIATFLVALRGYVRQRQERDSLEFLYESARALDGAPDLETGMGRVLQAACRTFRAELAQFVVPSPHDRQSVLLVTATADEPHRVDQVRVQDLDGLLLRALQSPQSQAVELDPPAAGPGGHALSQVLVAPLRSEPETLGALLIGNRLGAVGSFEPAHLTLLETLAAQVTASLENGRLARLLTVTAARADRERDNALVLQRGILPTLPPVAGAAVAVRYVPGAAEVEVGGDWYDVLSLPSGDVGVVIGDVLGHDLQAAAKMSQARSALRAYAAEGHSPAAVMELLNRLLAWTDPDFIGTCCYLQFDSRSGSVTVVSAGHPPPLIVHPDGGAHAVTLEANLPLGVDDAAAYEQATVTLPAGGTLVLFTDGLVECRTESLDTGLTRLAAVAGAAASADLQTLADQILAHTPTGHTDDDVTLLLLRHPSPTSGDGGPAPTPDVGRRAPLVAPQRRPDAG